VYYRRYIYFNNIRPLVNFFRIR